MRNFESYSPVILEPIKPKTTADFLGKEGPQQDIFEASKNLDLEKPINFDFNKEGINVVFLLADSPTHGK
jgi:hypothetical protein